MDHEIHEFVIFFSYYHECKFSNTQVFYQIKATLLPSPIFNYLKTKYVLTKSKIISTVRFKFRDKKNILFN